jgi:AraC-like DNA-binding protein
LVRSVIGKSRGLAGEDPRRAILFETSVSPTDRWDMMLRTKNMTDRDTGGGTIAAGFARALMELAVSKGADRKALAERSGIPLAELEDQDNRIALERYVALMRAGQEFDPALALHFGEAFEITELSIVGLIGQACETVADAFAQLGRYNRLMIDVEIEGPGDERLVLSRIGGRHWLIDRRRNPNEFPEITESSFARMICMSRRLGNAQIIKAVHVTHAPPAYRAEYDRIFQIPVTFESDKNALLMADGSWMNQRLAPSPRYVFGVLSAHADALLAELEASKTIRGRIESLLLPVLHTGDIGMDGIARRMGLSRKTLFRKLKAEGASFEQVLDELRHRLALDYLSARKVSVNETAYLTGFSEPAAFSRAFKRWTGTSPRDARAKR